MSKFKKGDKVRLLTYDSTRHLRDRAPLSIGDIGEVREDNSCAPYCVFSGQNYAIWDWDADALELVSKKDKPKTELRIVYKVVSKDWQSCSAQSSEWIVAYKLDHKIKPNIKGTYLYTFGDFVSAYHFKSQDNIVLRCVGNVVLDKVPKITSVIERARFWDGTAAVSGMPAPVGTVWCKWVFPIEEVRGNGE